MYPALTRDRPYRSRWSSPVPPSLPRKSKQVHLAQDMAHLPTWEDRHGGRSPPNTSLPCFPFMQHSVHKEGSGWVVVVACRLPVPMAAAPVSWVAFWAVRPAERGREGRKRYGPLFCRFNNLVISSHALSEYGILLVSYIGGYPFLFDVSRPPPRRKVDKDRGPEIDILEPLSHR